MSLQMIWIVCGFLIVQQAVKTSAGCTGSTSVTCFVSSSDEIHDFFANFSDSPFLNDLTITGSIGEITGTNILGQNIAFSKLIILTRNLTYIDPEAFGVVARDSIGELEINFSEYGDEQDSKLTVQNVFDLINNLTNLDRASVELEPNASLGPRLCNNHILRVLQIKSSRIARVYLEAFPTCRHLGWISIQDTPIDVIASDQDPERDSDYGIPYDNPLNFNLQNCQLTSGSFEISGELVYPYIFQLENNNITDLRPLGQLARSRFGLSSFNLSGNPIDCTDDTHKSYIYKAFSSVQIDANCSDGTPLMDFAKDFRCHLSRPRGFYTDKDKHIIKVYDHNHISCNVSTTQKIDEYFRFLNQDKLIFLDPIDDFNLSSAILTTLDGDDIFHNFRVLNLHYDLPNVQTLSPKAFGLMTRKHLQSFTPIDDCKSSSLSAKEYFAFIQDFDVLSRAHFVLKPNERLIHGMCQSHSLTSLSFRSEAIESVDLAFVSNCSSLQRIDFTNNPITQIQYNQNDHMKLDKLELTFDNCQLTSDSFKLATLVDIAVSTTYDFTNNQITDLRPLSNLLKTQTIICDVVVTLEDNPIARDEDHLDWMAEHLYSHLECIHFPRFDFQFDETIQVRHRFSGYTSQLEKVSAKNIDSVQSFNEKLQDFEDIIDKIEQLYDRNLLTYKNVEKSKDVMMKIVEQMLSADGAWQANANKMEWFGKINTVVLRFVLFVNGRLSSGLKPIHHESEVVTFDWRYLELARNEILSIQTSSNFVFTIPVSAIPEIPAPQENNMRKITLSVVVFNNYTHLLGGFLNNDGHYVHTGADSPQILNSPVVVIAFGDSSFGYDSTFSQATLRRRIPWRRIPWRRIPHSPSRRHRHCLRMQPGTPPYLWESFDAIWSETTPEKTECSLREPGIYAVGDSTRNSLALQCSLLLILTSLALFWIQMF